VKIWDLSVGKCVSTLSGHSDNVWYLQFDEDKIVSGSADKTICFWDSRLVVFALKVILKLNQSLPHRSGKCYSTLMGHERGLSCLHFEDDLLMSGSADR